MCCSLPGSSVHGLLQARILEWVAISFSRDIPDPGIEPGLLHCRQIHYQWAIRAAPVRILQQWVLRDSVIQPLLRVPNNPPQLLGVHEGLAPSEQAQNLEKEDQPERITLHNELVADGERGTFEQKDHRIHLKNSQHVEKEETFLTPKRWFPKPNICWLGPVGPEEE